MGNYTISQKDNSYIYIYIYMYIFVRVYDMHACMYVFGLRNKICFDYVYIHTYTHTTYVCMCNELFIIAYIHTYICMYVCSMSASRDLV